MSGKQDITVSIKVDQETKEKLVQLAKSEYRTVSGYIKTVINREYEKTKRG